MVEPAEVEVLVVGWALPVAAPPVREAAVAIAQGRIAWIGPAAALPARFQPAPRRTFSHALLIPGLVNAHCHVQLTALRGRLQPGTPFVAWVRQLLAEWERWSREEEERSTEAGLARMLHAGITTVAHVSPDPPLAPFAASPLRAVLFHEALGFPARWAEARLAAAEAWLARMEAVTATAPRIRPAVAAHAPYSVSAPLLRGLAALAQSRAVPFSIHLAETQEEAHFLRDGGGELAELLRERGAADPAWKPPGMSPVAYADALGLLRRRGLAVHLNYLAPGDLPRLRQGITACWCPGAHRWFGHPSHPAPELLAAAVPLALGTDSLASNDDLDLLREMRLAAAAFPAIDPAEWLRAATLAGAAALGLDREIGSLEPGKWADLTLVEPAEGDTKDPHRALLAEGVRVRGVWIAGRQVR